MDRVLKIIRKEYPLRVRTKHFKPEDVRYETIRLQFEGSEDISVEDSLKNK